MIDERKNVQTPPPAPIESAIGPCPTIIQISRTPRHWKFTQHHRTTRPPPDILEAVTNGYNNTYHRSIKQSPASYKEKDEVYQWQLQYDTLPKQKRIRTRAPHSRYRFKLGQKVRVSFLSKPFQKQYDERWSRETYHIIGRSMKSGIPQYTLQDYSGETVKGHFYQSQL